jgi:hypothetical protein
MQHARAKCAGQAAVAYSLLESDNEKSWNPMQQYAMKLTRASMFFADLLATDLLQLCVFWILDVKKSAALAWIPSSRV